MPSNGDPSTEEDEAPPSPELPSPPTGAAGASTTSSETAGALAASAPFGQITPRKTLAAAVASAPAPVDISEEKELDDLEFLLASGPPSARRQANAPSSSSSAASSAALLPPPIPTRAEISVMPVAKAVQTLEVFAEHERVIDAVCDRWRGLSYGPQRRQSAADAGALKAIVKAMRTHPDAPSVQELCCLAIGNIVAGVDEPGVARKQLAADSGALSAICNAMQAHVDAGPVQEYGCFALGNICYAADDAGLRRKQAAADACAVSAIIAGMKKHSGDAAVAEYGCFAIGNICRAVGNKESDTDAERALAEEGKARKEAAVDAGALGVIVNAMRFFAKEQGVQQWGARALSNITYGSNEWREKARQAGARPQWLVGMAEAMEEIERHRDGAGSSKTERLAIRAPQPKASSTARTPPRRVPKVAPKQSSIGGMRPLPSAGALWR